MEVVLQSVTTGVLSNPLIVRKAEKNTSNVVADEPVSQLHKVAFAAKSGDHSYMALAGDNISMVKATTNNSSSEGIPETASWTIVSTERVQYNFYEVPNTSMKKITPAPVVEYLKVKKTNAEKKKKELNELSVFM